MSNRPSVVVFDYGSGNVRSAQRALEHVGADVTLTSDFETALKADGLFVPGVGMQVMFELGVEHGIETEGLSEWPGVVEKLEAEVLPHMGWNTVSVADGSKIFSGVENERFYFVHSYGVTKWLMPNEFEKTQAPSVSWCEYGNKFVAAVENGPLVATQFHPEKSGEAGLQILQNWLKGLK